MTDNAEVLTAVADAVANSERELALFDSLTRNAIACGKTVETLTIEITDLHDNANNLEAKARVNKLTSATSSLSLAESDLRAAQIAIGVIQARTIATGRVAFSACAEVLSGLIVSRRSNAKATIEKLVDVSQLGAFGNGFEFFAYSVLELKGLEDFFSYSESDATRQIHSLRSLRERFNELRALCEAEPGLLIPAVTVAAPVPVVAKPVVTGNQLGTLTTLAAA